MAKLDKTQYSKEEAARLMEIRRLEKVSREKKEQYSKRVVPINFVEEEIIDESRFAHNQNVSFVLGNGMSRATIEPEELKKYGPIYGCNALYRTFKPDYLIAVDVKMVLEINKSMYQQKNQVWTNYNKSYERLQHLNYFQPGKGWSSGPTALWLSAQHRHKKIYILGFDYQGLQEGQKFNNVYASTPNYKTAQDSATYYGNWLRQTQSVIKEHEKTQFIRVIAPDNYCPEELNKLDNYSTITVDELKNQYVLT
tara:strand:+ start:68 stop:826 length:759 start_codon:yes stop_codon:yes gene_type:complete